MLLARFGPEGFYAAGESFERMRLLYSDPFTVPPAQWSFGRAVDFGLEAVRAPLDPGKVVGVGRNYREHARELGNPVPAEPVLFLKSPGSVVGPNTPIVLPPESERVEFEGEIAVVVRERLSRAGAEEAAASLLGVTCACDVTARDLQRRDATFARAKSFDTFCPLGPAVWTRPDLGALEVITRINGEERQRGSAAELTWPLAELVAYASRCMTLEPGDVVLAGTPAGVGPLDAGDVIEVEIPGLGVLVNPVEEWRGT